MEGIFSETSIGSLVVFASIAVGKLILRVNKIRMLQQIFTPTAHNGSRKTNNI